ncbi:ABC transporter family substrate-binding protein [Streptomyces xiamenensis]|uniref:ABC transporter family substrate-binding protein n=1 Tax=Streptomyces xiamenensis TaxID=408015 RepID=UPI0036E90601
MTRIGRASKLGAALLGGALVLSACGSDSDGGDDAGKKNDGGGGSSDTVTLAWAQPLDSYNPTTAGANSNANGTILNGTVGGFWGFDGERGLVTPHEEFGTYEKVSDDPLTVEYTINENAQWSDGVPIDCLDVQLWWTQQAGAIDGLFSAVGTQGIEDTTRPECEPGGKSFTLVYDTPYADWETAGPGVGNNKIMPAHVVAAQGGLSEEELLTALLEEDADALADAATFFNEGWLINGALPDESIIPSSGPYKLSGYEEGQSVTLSANEAYWGEQPATKTIVVRMVAEEQQVQALQNGEVDVIQPQPTVDVANQLENATGIQTFLGDQYTYEHWDFNFDRGPFSDSLELRQAFALCAPRQQIVENLIQPIVPDASVKEVRNLAPWDPGYDLGVDAVAPVIAEFGTTDIDRARQILEAEDAVGTKIRVETLDNQRRNDSGALVKASCDQAGFDVEFVSSADFFDTTGGLSQGTFDVAQFAWIGSNQMSGWNSTFRTSECTVEGKGNNNGCYSNPQVDQLLDDILVAPNPEDAQAIAAEIELLLWEDLATIPIFQHPGITAWGDSVQNIVPNPSQGSITWNVHEWSKG